MRGTRAPVRHGERSLLLWSCCCGSWSLLAVGSISACLDADPSAVLGRARWRRDQRRWCFVRATWSFFNADLKPSVPTPLGWLMLSLWLLAASTHITSGHDCELSTESQPDDAAPTRLCRLRLRGTRGTPGDGAALRLPGFRRRSCGDGAARLCTPAIAARIVRLVARSCSANRTIKSVNVAMRSCILPTECCTSSSAETTFVASRMRASI